MRSINLNCQKCWKTFHIISVYLSFPTFGIQTLNIFFKRGKREDCFSGRKDNLLYQVSKSGENVLQTLTIFRTGHTPCSISLHSNGFKTLWMMALIAEQTLRSNIIIIKLVSDEIEIDKDQIQTTRGCFHTWRI